jgi:hypothetical protein
VASDSVSDSCTRLILGPKVAKLKISEPERKFMLKRLVVCLFLFALTPGLLAKITNGNPNSPDERFSVDSSIAADRLRILDSRGRTIFVLENSDGGHGVGVYWSRDSQRVVVVVQYKWYATLEAAKNEEGHWKSVPVPDFSQELNEKAQIYLGIKILGGSWSDYGSQFEDLTWLSNFKFQYIQTQNYGNGRGPKDESSDWKELHFVATMEFGSDTVRTDDITVIAVPAKSDDLSSGLAVQEGGTIENDPRYAPLDYRLNEVYSALRARLSPAKREQLRQLERAFLSRREQVRNNPNGFFALTEQQISTLQQMLNALTQSKTGLR